MAEIPSDVASSAAQTGFQAREVAKDRDGRAAGQSHTADRQTKAVNEADSTVETTDNDSRVYADAEGTGSQGRPFEEEENAPPGEEPAGPPENGITRDEKGRLHLDLEA